jgi:hypothetical protein
MDEAREEAARKREKQAPTLNYTPKTLNLTP